MKKPEYLYKCIHAYADLANIDEVRLKGDGDDITGTVTPSSEEFLNN